MALLFEAKLRYWLSILNFIVTGNHIHLIVSDASGNDSIPRTMKFIACRLGKEYNRRKRRKSAFWQDRYPAAALESGNHLWQCMVYVDLDMVRAGVVDHPSIWKWCGYHEIQTPKTRYRLIDHENIGNFSIPILTMPLPEHIEDGLTASWKLDRSARTIIAKALLCEMSRLS